MKKIFITIMIIVMGMLTFTACGSKEQSNAKDEKKPQTVANEDYFKWDEFEPTKIVGYTEEGLKQKELTIPEKCTEIAYGALQENPNLEKVYFKNADIIMAGATFRKCSALKYVELPENITEISESCFGECNSLEEIELPEKIERICEDAFYKCTKLRSVKLGTKVEEIGNSAFMSCANLELINLSDSLKNIGNYAFAYDNSLKQLSFPKGLERIGEWAFYNCHQFTKVELPETLTTLGTMAFTYCDGLKEIYLPASLKTIDKSTFGQRANVITVYVKEGSVADDQFDNYNDGMMQKMYY